MKYSLYKQASVIINQFLEKKADVVYNNPESNVVQVPVTMPGEPIPGLNDALDTNQEYVDKNVIGTYQPAGPIAKTLDYGFKPIIAADAYSSLSNPTNWGKDYTWTKFLPEAKHAGPITKVMNVGLNTPFIPFGVLQAYSNFKKSSNTDDPITSAGYAANGIANGVTTASALGQLIHASPKLSKSIAMAAKHGLRGSKWIGASRLIHGLRPLARLAPFMGPAMVIEMALEGGLAARERLMRGVEAYKHLPSDVASNYIATDTFGNTDEEGNPITPISEYAPATAYGVGESLRRASQYSSKVPPKPSTPGVLWGDLKNAYNVIFRGKRPINYEKERQKQYENALNYSFPSAYTIQQNLPEALKGKNPDEEAISVYGVGSIPGSAKINQTSATMFQNRPNNSWAGEIGNIWDAGKQPAEEALPVSDEPIERVYTQPFPITF